MTDRETRAEVRPAERGPWERARDESTKAHAAFVLYRDLGPDRSLRAAASQLGKSERLLKRWSSRHRWQDRLAAWEERQQAHAEESSRQARDDARERRIRNAEQLEKVAMAGLHSLVVRDPETGEVRFDQRLKPTDIAALIRVACRLLPTAPQEMAGEEDDTAEEALGRLSREDLDLLFRMLEKEPREDDGGSGDL